MAYNRQAGDAIHAVFFGSYTRPAGDAIRANFSHDIEIEIPETTISLSTSLEQVSGDVAVVIPETLISLAVEEITVSQVVSIPETIITITPEINNIQYGILLDIPETVIALTSDSVYEYAAFIPETQIILSARGVLEFGMPIPETIIMLDSEFSEFIQFTTEHADVYFIFTLTGIENATTDIEIPISSFQARKRNGDPTYLHVVIPGADYADEIAARRNGTLKIDMAYKQDGGLYIQRENIINAALDSVRTDEGTKSTSITLTGYKNQSYINKSITLTGSTYRCVSDGSVRHRLAKPHIFLNPGDTVSIGDDTFDANVISYYYRATRSGIKQNMEISEN